MILCEWDAPEGDPGQSCVHLFARILSMSFISVSIFSVCCYSSVSISMEIGLLSYSKICTLWQWVYNKKERNYTEIPAFPSHIYLYIAKKKGSNKSIFLRFEKQLTLTEGKSFLSFRDTRHQIKVWQKVKMNVSHPLTSGSHGRTLIMFGEYAC